MARIIPFIGNNTIRVSCPWNKDLNRQDEDEDEACGYVEEEDGTAELRDEGKIYRSFIRIMDKYHCIGVYPSQEEAFRAISKAHDVLASVLTLVSNKG
jgi:hypothetical protein